MNTTYDVRIYKTEIYRGTHVRSHRVRWKAGPHEWKRTFRSAAQADVFRGELLAAARKGEAFTLATGERVSWQRSQPGSCWYEFACAYVDMKWGTASAKYRRAIAQALTSATVVMVANTRGEPDSRSLRRALINWGYNTKQRAAAPEDVANILAWLAGNTSQVKELADPALARQLLTTATSRLDGTRAAASSVRRNRAVLLNALDYAVELKVLDENPLKHVKWRAPQIAHEVDRQVVVNPTQARALLAAVRAQQPSGPRLVAFFGALYYSGPRPEEAVGLRRCDVALPALVWDEKAQCHREPDDDWGELHIRTARPDVGRQWTDDGGSRDRRSLKHRAEGEIRTVPCPPPLTRLLREYLAVFAGEPADLLFHGVQGRSLPSITYRRAWDRARKAALLAEAYAPRWPGAPTTCGTRACPPGSTEACRQPRLPDRPATVLRPSCASTPNASTDSTPSPSAGSQMRWTTSDYLARGHVRLPLPCETHRRGLRTRVSATKFGAYLAQMPADGRRQPPPPYSTAESGPHRRHGPARWIRWS